MPFRVTIIRAFELHNTQFVGEQKVFAQVAIGMDRRCTGERHGTHPHFNETLQFEGPPQGQHLEIELLSTHLTGPKLVGRGRFPLAEAEMAGAITTVVQLFEESGNPKGQLEINVEFTQGFMQAAAEAPVMYEQQPMMYAQPPAMYDQQPIAVVEQPGMYRDPYLAEAVAVNNMERREFDRDIVRHAERREFDRDIIRQDERREFDRDVIRDDERRGFDREVRNDERRDFDRDVRQDERREHEFGRERRW